MKPEFVTLLKTHLPVISSFRRILTCGLSDAVAFNHRLSVTKISLPSPSSTIPNNARAFSSSPKSLNWLAPKRGHTQKNRKGRCRVPTGGSTRGTTVVWGDYGIRLRQHDGRISSQQLAIGAETIKKRLRGQKYRLFTRVAANIGVYTSGNESRMGTGKGSFDHWAARVAVSQIVFEIKSDLHEQVVRDALRLAGNKLPGELLKIHPRKWHSKLMDGQGYTSLQRKVTRQSWVSPKWKLESRWLI